MTYPRITNQYERNALATSIAEARKRRNAAQKKCEDPATTGYDWSWHHKEAMQERMYIYGIRRALWVVGE